MTAPITRVSPYQGLTPFDEADASYFYGRDKDIRLICADLFAAPFSVLYGASGVGKSSVLRAGVVPSLRPRKDLVVVVFGRWQGDPLFALKSAISDAVSASLTQRQKRSSRIMRQITKWEFEPLASYITTCAKVVKRRLIIILDQFEEYSLYHPEDNDQFALEFPAATQVEEVPISFLLSLREDAVARLDRFEGRIPNLLDNYRRIEHLDMEAGRAAIERPIARYNDEHPSTTPIIVEPNLVDQVLNEVRAGRFQIGTDTGKGTTGTTISGRIEAPYLQLVMTRLWEKERRDGSSIIRRDTLASLGGAPKIVQKHLDDVMGRLRDDQLEIAASILQLLVTPSGTKIAHTATDLALSAHADRQIVLDILQALSSGWDRILRSVAALPELPEEPRYEIYHDRLSAAVLDWRARYLKNKEIADTQRKELESRPAPLMTAHRDPRPASRARGSGTRSGLSVAVRPIFESMRRGQVVVVLGAGVASSGRPAGLQWSLDSDFLPTSWELTQILAHDLDDAPADISGGSLTEVASIYSMMFGRGLLVERLEKIFGRLREPTPTHRLLAALSTPKPLVIVTTTYDDLMERAFDLSQRTYEVVTNTVQKGLTEPPLLWRRRESEKRVNAMELSPAQGSIVVYKMFGSAGQTKGARDDNFIVTEEDEMSLFADFSAGRLPPHYVTAHLLEYPTLFLGMGLGSWTQRLLLSRLRLNSAEVRGWAVVKDVSPIDERRWKKSGVTVIDADVNDLVGEFQKMAPL